MTFQFLLNSGPPSRSWLAATIVLSVFLAVVVAVATDRFLTRKTAEARLTGEAPTAGCFSRFLEGLFTGPARDHTRQFIPAPHIR